MHKLNLINVEKYFGEMASYESLILFGCGQKGKQAMKILKEKGICITSACDNNASLWGKKFADGLIVQSFEAAIKNKKNFCVVISCSINNALEINAFIKSFDEEIPVYNLSNPFKVENDLLELDNYELQKKVYGNCDLLEDKESRAVYIDTINWKLTGNMFEMQKYDCGDGTFTFFDSEFVHVDKKTVYVDVGAYTGDSIASFLMFSGGKYKKIIGFEADEGNFRALNDFIKFGKIKNIESYNATLWDREEEKLLYTTSSNENIHYDCPNLFESADKIADKNMLASIYDKGDLKAETVHVNTLDNVLKNEIPSIIKINAMAADYNILLGGGSIIKKYKPCLIFEYGIKKEDIFRMLETIKEINFEYKFYMRRKRVFDDIKTVLYCV